MAISRSSSSIWHAPLSFISFTVHSASDVLELKREHGLEGRIGCDEMAGLRVLLWAPIRRSVETLTGVWGPLRLCFVNDKRVEAVDPEDDITNDTVGNVGVDA